MIHGRSVVKRGMATMAGSAFVDTNVLLRATLQQMPDHLSALRLVEQAWRRDVELWINRQIIREYLVYLTRPQNLISPVDRNTLQQRSTMLRTMFRVADETDAITEQLVTLLGKYSVGGKQVHDANIVATMLVYNIPTLLTQNVADFKRFADIIQISALTVGE